MSLMSSFQVAVLDGSFQPMQGETPWTIIGIWPLLLLLIAALVFPGRYFKKI